MTFEGKCEVEGTEIAVFRASINSDNLEELPNFSNTPLNKELCKTHRATVRADEAEFEDMVYAKHEEMQAATEQATTEA